MVRNERLNILERRETESGLDGHNDTMYNTHYYFVFSNRRF